MSPAEGAWFFVYLRPRWTLLTYRSDRHGEAGHSSLWERHVAAMIGRHYGIDPDRVYGFDSVRNAYAGMPRGRVLRKGGKWILYHGGDTPMEWGRAKKLLLARFGLAGEARKKNVEFATDEHETMIREDQETLSRAVGPIPYGKAAKRAMSSREPTPRDVEIGFDRLIRDMRREEMRLRKAGLWEEGDVQKKDGKDRRRK